MFPAMRMLFALVFPMAFACVPHEYIMPQWNIVLSGGSSNGGSDGSDSSDDESMEDSDDDDSMQDFIVEDDNDEDPDYATESSEEETSTEEDTDGETEEEEMDGVCFGEYNEEDPQMPMSDEMADALTVPDFEFIVEPQRIAGIAAIHPVDGDLSMLVVYTDPNQHPAWETSFQLRDSVDIVAPYIAAHPEVRLKVKEIHEIQIVAEEVYYLCTFQDFHIPLYIVPGVADGLPEAMQAWLEQ